MLSEKTLLSTLDALYEAIHREKSAKENATPTQSRYPFEFQRDAMLIKQIALLDYLDTKIESHRWSNAQKKEGALKKLHETKALFDYFGTERQKTDRLNRLNYAQIVAIPNALENVYSESPVTNGYFVSLIEQYIRYLAQGETISSLPGLFGYNLEKQLERILSIYNTQEESHTQIIPMPDSVKNRFQYIIDITTLLTKPEARTGDGLPTKESIRLINMLKYLNKSNERHNYVAHQKNGQITVSFEETQRNLQAYFSQTTEKWRQLCGPTQEIDIYSLQTELRVLEGQVKKGDVNPMENTTLLSLAQHLLHYTRDDHETIQTSFELLLDEVLRKHYQPKTNVSQKPSSEIENHPTAPSFHILNGFIAALGVAAVAVAFLVFNAVNLATAGILLACAGATAVAIGGYGLFSKANEASVAPLSHTKAPAL
ncbi:MAG: hypothetical protein P1U32_03970 [Legionellaceae bacterium]|nr:hypothetical protein [Legionellaceae bacterium]